VFEASAGSKLLILTQYFSHFRCRRSSAVVVAVTCSSVFGRGTLPGRAGPSTARLAWLAG
jgi:hypothetical protein